MKIKNNVKCNICGNDTYTIHDKQFNIDYFKCKKCEFIQIDKNKIVSVKEEKQVYDLHNNSLECKGYVEMFNKFIKKAISPFYKKGDMLDFGSGPEPVFSQLIKRDYEYNVDIYDLYYQPKRIFENKRYDIITAIEVLEHLKEPMKTISLIKDHLNEKGIFAFMTLLHNNSTEEFLKWWYRRDETHISFFSIETIKYIADFYNFKLVYSDEKRVFTFQNN